MEAVRSGFIPEKGIFHEDPCIARPRASSATGFSMKAFVKRKTFLSFQAQFRKRPLICGRNARAKMAAAARKWQKNILADLVFLHVLPRDRGNAGQGSFWGFQRYFRMSTRELSL